MDRDESLRLLAAIVEDTDDAIVSKDLDGRILSWNAAAERLFGYAAGEAIGRSITMLLPPDRLREEDELLGRIRAGQRVDHFETKRRRKDGAIVEVSVTVSPLRDAGGRVIGASKIAREITERKRIERALRASEERLRLFVAHVPAAVAMFDQAMRYLAVSRRFLLDYRVADADVIGRSHYDVFPEIPERWKAVHRRCLAGAIERADEEPFERPDGSVDWVRWEMVPWRDADGEIGGAVLFSENVTARKRAEEALRAANEQLQEADRNKDEFLGMLSHELRNPLAPISNALYLLERTDPAGAQAHRARAVLSRQVAHMTRLVDDLLDVTRIARGKIALRAADLDLTALVRRTAEDHRPTLQGRGIAFAVEVGPAPLPVHGDETRLAQVIGNLLHNAAKFTSAGGRVTIAAARAGDAAEVRVRDTGAGIPPELLEHVFEPFTQAKQTLARTEGGLGLGLALVKALVELHGGTVSASSAGTGRGSEFVVRLPLR